MMSPFSTCVLLFAFLSSIGAFKFDPQASALSAAKEATEESGGRLWALLVAGSRGWDNYRHQADVCHAYQLLHRHGVPDERIIVMMYDDIALHWLNPSPNVIVNEPNGADVYAGVPHDYTGDKVTPENFLAALEGNRSSSSGAKVIDSNDRDHIFVNFVDHGAPGMLSFPHGELYARELMETVERMHRRKRYASLVFYVEACESGSMFDHLLRSDMDVYATTASDPTESSYACNYDKVRATYVSDCYSLNWLNDSERDEKSETLSQQFHAVRQATKKSHVSEYGDLQLARHFRLATFQGGNNNKLRQQRLVRRSVIENSDSVPNDDVPLHILRHRIEDASTRQERNRFRRQLASVESDRRAVRLTMRRIVERFGGEWQRLMVHHEDDGKMADRIECVEMATRALRRHCFDFGERPYALRQVYVLDNLCREGYELERVEAAMREECLS